MENLAIRWQLITGAAQGMAAATAGRLAAEGAIRCLERHLRGKGRWGR